MSTALIKTTSGPSSPGMIYICLLTLPSEQAWIVFDDSRVIYTQISCEITKNPLIPVHPVWLKTRITLAGCDGLEVFTDFFRQRNIGHLYRLAFFFGKFQTP